MKRSLRWLVPPYGDIHHRTETLRGLSDGELLALWAPATGGASRSGRAA